MSARFCQEEQVAESELLLMTQEFDQMHKGTGESLTLASWNGNGERVFGITWKQN
jgi:hypothetical protein